MNALVQMAEIARIARQLDALCGGDDEQLFHDMLVGETEIDRIVLRIWEQVARDEEMLAGIGERQAALAERKARIANRIAAGKNAIGKVLRAGQLTRLELPEATFSVRAGRPGLAIVSPDAVPEPFLRSRPEPDKTAINAAYADADELPNWLAREPARDVVTVRTK